MHKRQQKHDVFYKDINTIKSLGQRPCVKLLIAQLGHEEPSHKAVLHVQDGQVSKHDLYVHSVVQIQGQ